MNKLIIKRIVIFISSCVLVIIGIIAICYASVVSNAEGRTYDSVDSIPHNRVGLLLATSPITPGGAHNFYFENRIKAAEELFMSGKVDLIIASGGDYTQTVKNGCDEPKAIRDSLVSRGIAADRIILDYDGTRTINSIAKAKEIYRLDTLTIISQRYHNERAIYLADKYGLHAIGFNAEPSPIRRNRIKNTLREYLARVKMFIDVFQNKPMKFNHEVSESENNLLYNRIFLPFKDSFDPLDPDGYWNNVKGHKEEQFIVGNFTGNSVDTIYMDNLYPDESDWSMEKWLEMQYEMLVVARSNNKRLPDVPLYQPSGLVYEGDLDGNGTDEWGYLPTGSTSQWRSYCVYTYRNGKWCYLIHPISTERDMRRSGYEILTPGPKGKVEVHNIDDKSELGTREIHTYIVTPTFEDIDD